VNILVTWYPTCEKLEDLGENLSEVGSQSLASKH
jgi:hypothetical protein